MNSNRLAPNEHLVLNVFIAADISVHAPLCYPIIKSKEATLERVLNILNKRARMRDSSVLCTQLSVWPFIFYF